MMIKFLLMSLRLSPLVGVASAWGPRFEPLHGGFVRALLFQTFGMKEHGDAEPEEYVSLGAFKNYVDSKGLKWFDTKRPLSQIFISQPIIWDATVFGGENPFSAVIETNDSLEDPDECPIPDEYRKIAEENPVDVLAFLGIRRAEPIAYARRGKEYAP